MTPPTVELAAKESNSDIKVVFPPSSNVQQLEKNIYTKKYKYFASVFVFSAILIAAVVVGSISLHHHLNSEQTVYETEILYKGYHIPEHAYVDYVNQIAYVNNSRYKEVVAANNLHDYKRQFMVFKDVENKVCYIDKLQETFEEGLSRLAEKKVSYQTPVKPVIISKKPVDERIVRKLTGDAIADHCKGIPTFWVISDGPSTKDDKEKTHPNKCNGTSSVLCREKRETAQSDKDESEDDVVIICAVGRRYIYCLIIVSQEEAQDQEEQEETQEAPSIINWWPPTSSDLKLEKARRW